MKLHICLHATHYICECRYINVYIPFLQQQKKNRGSSKRDTKVRRLAFALSQWKFICDRREKLANVIKFYLVAVWADGGCMDICR